jgi:hypothetical protein
MNYDWKRYWHKFGNSPHISNGFLFVSEYLKDVFSLDEVLDTSCLILLGEPGMGKSNEIERIYKTQVVDENNDKLYFPLSSFGNEDRLVREIFQSDTINQWKSNNKNLHLYLDGLDEALLSINPLALLLADEIEKLPKERLFLRIACRTAEWSNLSALEDKLKGIWKEDKFKILQIALLQSKDVEIAAQTEKLESQKFLAEIYDKNVSEFASTPFDLQFLLDIFNEKKSLPFTQKEIYEKGCLIKCEENNERRKAAKRIGKLKPEQKFRIASRIAALMIFGNKSSIWIGGILGIEKTSDISISELDGYNEQKKDSSEFHIEQEEIEEVIFNTSLFTGNGSNRLKFSHKKFAEFLASWYLEYKKIPDEVVIEIIGKEYLYPQLYETSAWIANQRPSIFHHLMKVAPAILLRSDILLADESARVKLVDILLDMFDKEESEGIDRNYYRKLKHPKIAEQIKPYIVDKTKGWLVRSEALDMVQACEIKELQNDLVSMALDKEDDHNIRVRAAYAVGWVGDNEKKAELKPLVFGKQEDDPRFRLKGVAVDMLWNKYLTAKELFSVLSTPSNYFTGSYEVFLNSEFIEKLKIEDLPVALDWLIENIGDFVNHSLSERKLADKILLMAWDNLERKEIFDRFIKITKIFISHYDEFFKEINDKEKLSEILEDDEKRRKIWLEIFPSIDDNHYWAMDESKFIGLRNSDISWLVHQWRITDDEPLKEKLLSRLLGFISLWGTHPDVLDEISKACDENEELNKIFEEVFAAIELNTKKAFELKRAYEELIKGRREREKKRQELEKPIDPSPIDSTLKSLEKFENGEINSFISVNYYLMLLPNGRPNVSEYEADLTKLPVWKNADEDTKARIIRAAKKYLEKGNPENEKWIVTENYQYSALSGYKGLVLLDKCDPEYINGLSNNVWEKWAAIIYRYPYQNDTDEYERKRKFVAKAYQSAPDQIIELLNRDIESDKENECYWSLEKLKYCWDKRLKTFLKYKVKKNDLSIYAVRKILSQLLELNDEEAEKIGCDFIKYPIPESKKEQELLMLAVELLISYGKVNCWEKIWNILEKDSAFGSAMIEYGCFRFERGRMQDLSEKHLADVYLWLSEKYPHKEDPIHYGVYSPGFRDKVTDWRESLLSSLVEKGTIESVKEVERIKNNLTEVEWLKRTVLRAEEKRRTTSWQPNSPQKLLELFCVNNEQQVQVNPILENIEKKFDLVLSKIDDNHRQIMEQFADSAMSKIQNEISKLSEKEKEEFEEVKKGKWETKIKFCIPLIPKIPYLGEFFPSASIETTKTIESDEYIDFVQRKLYGDKLQTNILAGVK